MLRDGRPTMSTRDLQARLRQAERVYSETVLTAEAERRIWNRLQPRPAAAARNRWRLAIPVGALAVAVAVLVVVRSHAPSRPTLGGLRIVDSTPDLRATESSDQTIDLTAGGCTLF